MAVHALHQPRLSREEKLGLGVAIAAHVALIAWLALEPLGKDIQPPPERMTVSFADAVAPQATSPEPMAEAAPDVAPTLGEAPSEPEPESEPRPLVRPDPAPAPRPVVTPQPRPAPPVARPSARPTAKPSARPTARPSAKPSTPAAARQPPRSRSDRVAGGSRVGEDFLKGLGGTSRTPSPGAPEARAGPQVAASLSQAISRQLKPRWTAPQGAEADQLVTVLSFELNEDGSLAGKPRVVSQSGVTDANRAQQARHAEQAIRAVQLAAPFDLPAQYYSLWKRVASFRFDRRLSQ